MPSVKEILFGSNDKAKKVSTQTPEMEQLMKDLLEGISSGKGPLADIFNFNKENFDKGVTEPALKNFKENILPQIQHGFIGGGQVGGSGMERAQNKAGVDLQSKLAELMYGAQNQANQNKLTGTQIGLGQKPFENTIQQGKTGVVSQILPAAAQIATQAIAG